MCFVTLGHFWHFTVFLDIMTNTLAGKDDYKCIICRILGRHLQILWFYVYKCMSGMLLFFFRLSFFSSLAYLLQSSSCSNCVYIYVPHFFWTPIWWTMYSREIINTDCHFWFRKRSVLRPLETDPTHGLIVVYIYKALWTKKKEIKIMLSPIFQVTLKKTCACAGSNLLAD